MKYIIIGAVAGGASAAARLRRLNEKAEIVIFEKGEYISYANCGLPYYIGDVISDRNKLFVQTATSFRNRFNIDVRISTEVTGIDAMNKTVSALSLIHILIIGANITIRSLSEIKKAATQLLRQNFVICSTMVQAYNFLASWQLFPEKGVYEYGCLLYTSRCV